MNPETSSQQQVWEGVVVAWGLLFAVFFVSFAAFVTWSDWGPNGPTDEWTSLPLLWLSYSGLTQLVYVVPGYVFFLKKKMPNIARGLLWGAASIFVLNLLGYLWWLRG